MNRTPQTPDPAAADGSNETDDSNPTHSPVHTPRLASLGYPGLLLGVAVLLSTTLLALGYQATKDAIAERQAEDLNASLGQVLPAALHDNDLLQAPLEIRRPAADAVRVYRGQRQRNIRALAFGITAPDGYGGPIRMLMGVDIQGRLLGVRVLSHSETPGLGDKIEIAKSDWILGFDGQSLANLTEQDWAVKKDGGRFDQFTGATVTPRAIVKAVRQGLLFYRQHQATLLVPPVNTPVSTAASAAQISIRSTNNSTAKNSPTNNSTGDAT